MGDFPLYPLSLPQGGNIMKPRWILVLFSLMVMMGIGGCSPLGFFSSSPSRAFESFLDDYFNGAFALRPSSTEPLAWLSATADSLRAVSASRAMRELTAIDTSQLSMDERIDWLQMEAMLKREVRDRSLNIPLRIPGQYLTLGTIYGQVARRRPPTPEEWKNIRKAIDDARAAMETGRRQLHEPPPLWVRLTVNTAARYEEFLGEPLVTRIKTAAPDSLRPGLLKSTEETRRALVRFRTYLSDTLKPGKDDSWGVGEEYYDWLLKEVHFLPYNSAQLIEEGWRRHNETKKLLKDLAQRIDPEKSWKEVIEEMKSRHPEPGGITEAYRVQSDRARRLLVDLDLVAIPEPETLTFVPTPPALRETYAWAGYGGITIQDKVPTGRFFVTDIVPEMSPDQVEEKLRAQNRGWITVIALHEGYPGHHLQNLYAMKSSRKVRSRFGSTYYGEGWGLYAESWMARSGFYQTTDDSLAWLHMRLWRTARVIIDPSIHTGRMTYEQAVRFFVEEVGLERSAAEAEVNRYTTWPTQAPSYIIGWLEIEKLKEELRQALGEQFSEKQFVETLLGVGSLPLELLKRAVRYQYGYQLGKVVANE